MPAESKQISASIDRLKQLMEACAMTIPLK